MRSTKIVIAILTLTTSTISLFIGVALGSRTSTADRAEIARMAERQTEVVKWVAFLESDNERRAAEGLPILPSSTMRGLAEMSADHFWPLPREYECKEKQQ